MPHESLSARNGSTSRERAEKKNLTGLGPLNAVFYYYWVQEILQDQTPVTHWPVELGHKS